MVKVTIVVREVGKLKVDYSLDFELAEVPAVGSYLSIHRPDKQDPFGEDLIVRKIWWRLEHPETSGFGSNPPKVGSLKDIFVECDPAIGPYSSDTWRDSLARSAEAGLVETFEVERFSVRESELNPKA